MVTNEQRIERLTHLARVLLRVNEVEKLTFDMDFFFNAQTDEDGHACGTAACALGYAASDPVNQRQGLKSIVATITKDEKNNFDEYKIRSFDVADQEPGDVLFIINDPEDRAKIGDKIPRDVERQFERDYEAGAEFYGLNWLDTKYLFSPSTYYELSSPILPSDVALRVLELLKKFAKEEAA